MTRVLIVDDDPLVRSALQPDARRAAGHRRSWARPATAATASGWPGAARRRGADGHPDAAVSGLEATRTLFADPDPPHVIVLTTFDADEHVMSALAAGADGFLLKDTPPAQILEAIRSVAAGNPMLSPSVTRTLIDKVRTDPAADRAAEAKQRLEALTGRELEVALAVGRGMSNAEIASELYLSVPTVKAHVSRLFEKLEVTNRVQIAICVHESGLNGQST